MVHNLYKVLIMIVFTLCLKYTQCTNYDHCTACTLYPVPTVLRAHCTQYLLYCVHTVLRVPTDCGHTVPVLSMPTILSAHSTESAHCTACRLCCIAPTCLRLRRAAWASPYIRLNWPSTMVQPMVRPLPAFSWAASVNSRLCFTLSLSSSLASTRICGRQFLVCGGPSSNL